MGARFSLEAINDGDMMVTCDDDNDNDDGAENGGSDDEIPKIYPSCCVCFQSFIFNPRQDRPKNAMQFIISFRYSSILSASYNVAASLFW